MCTLMQPDLAAWEGAHCIFAREVDVLGRVEKWKTVATFACTGRGHQRRPARAAIHSANHCELLGVRRRWSTEDIKRTYRLKMLLLHPDKTRAAAPDTHPHTPLSSARSLLRARTAGCVVQAESTGLTRPT